MKNNKSKVAHEVKKTQGNIAKAGADLSKKVSKLDTKQIAIIAGAAVVAVLVIVVTIVVVNSNSGPKVPEITKTETKKEEKKAVPNVMGLDHENAKKVLEAEGFTVTEIEADAGPMLEGAGYSRDVNKGTVFRVNDVYYSSYSDTFYQPKVEDKKVTIYYAKTDYKDGDSSTSLSNSNSSSSTSNSSSSSTSSSSNGSSSSSSNSTNSLCTSSYEDDLKVAKTAYETAQSTYDSMKKLGMSASDLSSYQAAIDMAKASLDAAQKIYDTYCK